MKLSIGIVGMPNVGKSTLFNALLKKQVALEANYPFATIDPNVGIIEVPDGRLARLAEIVHTSKLVPAAVEFYDIAGLVKGASTGEGLGNKFLSHIREVAAIVHVVRMFTDKDIIHVNNVVNAADDVQTIDAELALADLATLSKQREPKGNAASKESIIAYKVFTKVKEALDGGVAVRNQILDEEEAEIIRQLNLLTAKPLFYCFNCTLEQLEDKAATEQKVRAILTNNEHFLLFNPLIETTLDDLIKQAYATLNLISFLTAGELEVRAWTIGRGTLAPQAAATIHTDFEKKFIKADIVSYTDFVACSGWAGARTAGKVTSAGRDYTMQEGDIVEFKIGA